MVSGVLLVWTKDLQEHRTIFVDCWLFSSVLLKLLCQLKVVLASRSLVVYEVGKLRRFTSSALTKADIS